MPEYDYTLPALCNNNDCPKREQCLNWNAPGEEVGGGSQYFKGPYDYHTDTCSKFVDAFN